MRKSILSFVAFKASLWTGFHTKITSYAMNIKWLGVFMPKKANLTNGLFRTDFDTFPACRAVARRKFGVFY